MAKAVRAKQVQVKTPNKQGMGAALFEALRDAGINVIGSCCYEMGREAWFWIIVEKVPRALKALRAAGFRPTTSNVILTWLPNRPGALARTLAKVAKEGVNMRFSYASAHKGPALVVLMTTNDTKALRALR